MVDAVIAGVTPMDDAIYDKIYDRYIQDTILYKGLTDESTELLSRFYSVKSVADATSMNNDEPRKGLIQGELVEIITLIKYCKLDSATKKVDRVEKLLNM